MFSRAFDEALRDVNADDIKALGSEYRDVPAVTAAHVEDALTRFNPCKSDSRRNLVVSAPTPGMAAVERHALVCLDPDVVGPGQEFGQVLVIERVGLLLGEGASEPLLSLIQRPERPGSLLASGTATHPGYVRVIEIKPS